MALGIEEYEAAEAKKRVGGRPEKGTERIPDVSTGEARDKAAAAGGVNPRYVSDRRSPIATSVVERIPPPDDGLIAPPRRSPIATFT